MTVWINSGATVSSLQDPAADLNKEPIVKLPLTLNLPNKHFLFSDHPKNTSISLMDVWADNMVQNMAARSSEDQRWSQATQGLKKQD